MKYNSNDIYLRPLVREDAMISYAWRNDPEVWQYTDNRPDRIITPEIELDWIDKVLRNVNRRSFAICLKHNDKYVGNVQLTDIDDEKGIFHIFIGDKEIWGKGVGALATAKLLAIAKEQLHLKKILLHVNLKNSAAVKIYLKCNFNFIDEHGNMELYL